MGPDAALIEGRLLTKETVNSPVGLLGAFSVI